MMPGYLMLIRFRSAEDQRDAIVSFELEHVLEATYTALLSFQPTKYRPLVESEISSQ